MVHVQNSRGVPLSIGACVNGWPNPVQARQRIHRDTGDYAATNAGRMRRADRRQRIAFKLAGLEG